MDWLRFLKSRSRMRYCYKISHFIRYFSFNFKTVKNIIVLWLQNKIFLDKMSVVSEGAPFLFQLSRKPINFEAVTKITNVFYDEVLRGSVLVVQHKRFDVPLIFFLAFYRFRRLQVQFLQSLLTQVFLCL